MVKDDGRRKPLSAQHSSIMWWIILIAMVRVDAWNSPNKYPFRRRSSMVLGRLYSAKDSVSSPARTDPFNTSMRSMGFSDTTISSIQNQLIDSGLQDSSELVLLATDFVDRPEVFANVLQSDFGFPPLLAHQTRAAVIYMISTKEKDRHKLERDASNVELTSGNSSGVALDRNVRTMSADNNIDSPILFKSVVVNEKAQKRRQTKLNEVYCYGLPTNYRDLHPTLAAELDEFYTFMTRPSTVSQEDPIRQATANVYMRHAKLFLGFHLRQCEVVNGESSKVSLFTVIPSKEKESAEQFLEFVLWLRAERRISVSYEANVLRGLTKLLKYRFAKESVSDPAYGEKSFNDIPLIRELRKLHRDANKRQSMAPRSSDEDRKWLSWSEYLKVIEGLKTDLFRLMEKCESESPKKIGTKQGRAQVEASKRRIATVFQQYLILSIFACVPDRQRTIRELELGRSLVKDEKESVWVIKHGPDDYKTGKTYGDRPPLVLSPELAPDIDAFLANWRACLKPTTEHAFVQPRTGNPLTQDSVYQIVARSCFKYSGKRTNPHLLRDMIVTHVRESDASEKQLEALALYMGHSIQMQRSSYDRRTLTKKVAPAVELLQSVNRQEKAMGD